VPEDLAHDLHNLLVAIRMVEIMTLSMPFVSDPDAQRKKFTMRNLTPFTASSAPPSASCSLSYFLDLKEDRNDGDCE
jgi:hypothetical protein